MTSYFFNIRRKVFSKDELEAAIRFMAAGKHMGKVVLKIRDENEPLDAPMLALPQYHCLEDRSYIILGGLGGFGLELGTFFKYNIIALLEFSENLMLN